jgi:hypothetical protein
VFPIEYDQHSAYFEVPINDSFAKAPTYKLDNKMGMSESVDDLYLLDFVLKDRDKFLIIFSGFIYARQATQQERNSLKNYFEHSDNHIKILESSQQSYKIIFIIIEEPNNHLLSHIKLTLFA